MNVHVNVFLLALDFVAGMLRDSAQGAANSLNAAVNPELNKEEFVYYSDCQPARTSAAAM